MKTMAKLLFCPLRQGLTILLRLACSIWWFSYLSFSSNWNYSQVPPGPAPWQCFLNYPLIVLSTCCSLILCFKKLEK
jgi:hypothetical protein